MKLKQILKDNYFSNKHILFLILENVLSLSKEKIYTNWDMDLKKDKVEKIKQMYDMYDKKSIPIEYILGYCEFMQEKFIVNENVLIPRPETEYLVKYVLDIVKKDDVVLDVGTGSGIIAIILKKMTKNEVYAIDISDKALELAKENAKSFNLNINFVLSDLLGNFKLDKNKHYIICANLPYLKEDYNLDEFAKKEPKLALFAGEDGLFYYKKLLNQIKNYNFTAFFELTKEQAFALGKGYDFNFSILETCHKNIKILKVETKK